MRCKYIFYVNNPHHSILIISFFSSNTNRLFGTLLYNSRHSNTSLGFTDMSFNYTRSSVRFLRWESGPFGGKCYSFWRHRICMMSVFDLPLVRRRPEFWADKFILSRDPVAYQCMEEWHEERETLEAENRLVLDLNHYCSVIEAHSSRARCGWRPPPVLYIPSARY
jgi:hypothetical protein